MRPPAESSPTLRLNTSVAFQLANGLTKAGPQEATQREQDPVARGKETSRIELSGVDFGRRRENQIRVLHRSAEDLGRAPSAWADTRATLKEGAAASETRVKNTPETYVPEEP